jgi:REP element-mobilizing transposase RayT
MELNDAGRMIAETWREFPEKYPGNSIDEFFIMPNHVHGIVTIVLDTAVGAAPCGRPLNMSNDYEEQLEDEDRKRNKGQPRGVAPTDEKRMSLSDIIHRIKSWTTKLYSVGVIQNGWEPFPGRLWQRNYYERILRNDDELNRIRDYISRNPMTWDEDRYNPSFTK